MIDFYLGGVTDITFDNWPTQGVVNTGGQHRVAVTGWLDSQGKPAIEQFRISGLGGNDTLGFLPGASAVDLTALNERSTDWAVVLLAKTAVQVAAAGRSWAQVVSIRYPASKPRPPRFWWLGCSRKSPR